MNDDLLATIAARLTRGIEEERGALERRRQQIEALERVAALIRDAGALADLQAEREAMDARELLLAEAVRQTRDLEDACLLTKLSVDLQAPPPASTPVQGSGPVSPAMDHSTDGAAADANAVSPRMSIEAAAAAPPAPCAMQPQGMTPPEGAGPPERLAPALVASEAARPPPKPPWEPRPLAELEMERKDITAKLSQWTDTTGRGQALFKSLVCHFECAALERTRHAGVQGEWRGLRSEFKARRTALWSARHYFVPLSQHGLEPNDWRHLAELYVDLGEAAAGLDWLQPTIQSFGSVWTKLEARNLLESIGAVTSRLHRWLADRLPDERDAQQQAIYDQLCECGHTHNVFLQTLRREASDAELEEAAAALGNRLGLLQNSTKERARRAEAVEAFESLVRQPGFGAREGDDDLLCDAAAACLKAGVPATNKRLRDPVVELGLADLLEEEEAVNALCKAVASEQTRRAKRAVAEEPAAETAISLPADLEQKRQDLLEFTHDRTAVIIGGIAREDNRRRIEQALELKELRWPSTEPSDDFDRSEQEIRRADLVFLTRFNRRKSRRAWEICRDRARPLVVIPKGYGLHQVLDAAHRALVHPPGP